MRVGACTDLVGCSFLVDCSLWVGEDLLRLSLAPIPCRVSVLFVDVSGFFWDWNSALRARECDQSVVGQSWNQKLPEEQPCRQEDFFWGGRSHSELGEDDDDREENNEKCS